MEVRKDAMNKNRLVFCVILFLLGQQATTDITAVTTTSTTPRLRPNG